MKITQMRYFSTACHLESITKAAEILYISQPAITASIKSLEDELGVLLLFRNKKNVIPTHDGELFLRQCDKILNNIDNLILDFQNISATHNTISVGIPPMIGYFLFPKIFADFKKKYPKINIKLTESGSELAKTMIKNGELELAIITMGNITPTGLSSKIIGSTQLVYCVNPSHPFACKKYIQFSEIISDPLILFSNGYYHEQLLKNRFTKENVIPNVLFNSNQIMTIKGFVKNNIANAFLLPQVIEPEDNIIGLPVKEPLSMNIAVVWRKDVYITKEAKQFIKFIDSHFNKTNK